MLLKLSSVAIVATLAAVTFAQAQGRAPAELPPAGFAGQQYVDSRGCLFIRAGHGGQVNWVARIDRNRQPICGQPPSLGVMAAARRELAAPVEPVQPASQVVAAAPAPVAPAPVPRSPARATVPAASYVPPPVTYGAPTPLPPARVATAPAPAATPAVPAPAPVATVAPAQAAAAAPQAAETISRTAGCPDHAPFGKVYPLHRGGSMLVCASGPHRLTGLRPGDIERMAEIRAASQAVPVRMAETDLMAPPAGFKPAWRDDRLNPNRAAGTPQGHQQMLQIWTDRPPQQLRDPADAQPRRSVASSMSAPVAPRPAQVAGGRFVQVGSFGVPENAARAVARLQALGLPVQVSRSHIKGKPVQVVQAGPFDAPGQAQSVLQTVRGAGFGDAILRR